MNFQVFKLVLENAEEPEINLPTSAGSWKKQESSTSALLTTSKPLTVWITTHCGKSLKRMGKADHCLQKQQKSLKRSKRFLHKRDKILSGFHEMTGEENKNMKEKTGVYLYLYTLTRKYTVK